MTFVDFIWYHLELNEEYVVKRLKLSWHCKVNANRDKELFLVTRLLPDLLLYTIKCFNL